AGAIDGHAGVGGTSGVRATRSAAGCCRTTAALRIRLGSAITRVTSRSAGAGRGFEGLRLLIKVSRDLALDTIEGLRLYGRAHLRGTVQALVRQPLRQYRRPTMISGKSSVGLLVLLDFGNGPVERCDQ